MQKPIYFAFHRKSKVVEAINAKFYPIENIKFIKMHYTLDQFSWIRSTNAKWLTLSQTRYNCLPQKIIGSYTIFQQLNFIYLD